MTAGVLLMAAGIFVAAVMRSKRWWLRTHKTSGIAAVTFMSAGFIAAFLFVQDSSGIHFKILHARIGAATLIFGMITPLLGFMQFRIRNPQVKVMHRWLGRSTLVFAIAAIVLGLSAAGFF